MEEPVTGSQVVAVVGATSGIGWETALRCAWSGRRMVVAGRRSDKLEELVQAVIWGPATGPLARPGNVVDKPLALSLDVRAADAGRKLVDTALSHYGRLDVLVYAAGWNVPRRALSEVTHESWDTILATNLTGAFTLTKALLPVMRDQGSGTFIYISSSGAKQADGSGTAYQASKAGLAALAHATMVECRQDNIRATVIYPGLTETPFLEHRPSRLEAQALRLALKPGDVAAACMFVMDLPARAYVPELLIYPSRQP